MFAILIFVFTVSSLTHVNMASSPSDQEKNFCFLPLYPEHGTYKVRIHKQGRYSSVKLDISCDSGYVNNSTVKSISCVNGEWSPSMPTCVLDLLACGLTSQHWLLEGRSSNLLELPWNVVIYEKEAGRYQLRCTGSLITATKVISGARCFHDTDNELQPASDFKMAVDKMYSEYNDTRDRNSQYSDVGEIIIPETYRGSATNYEDDIAIVVVKTPFLFDLSVLPVCIDFDNDLDTQLAQGNSGKVAAWSSVVNNGEPSRVLHVVERSYIKNEDCNTILPTYFRKNFPNDKFCARDNIERGYTYYGSGLAFLDSTTQRYFLRGVYSEMLSYNDGRVTYSYTSIKKHEHFIKQHL